MWRFRSLAGERKPPQLAILPRTIGRQAREEDIETLPQCMRVIASSDSHRIRRNRTVSAKRYGKCPGQTVGRFRITERRVVRNNHHVTLDGAVVVDVEVALLRRFREYSAGITRDSVTSRLTRCASSRAK
jgi:hypothetical protein